MQRDVFEFFHYIWRDIYWLASLMIFLTLIGAFLEHHYDSRLRMLGSRMRVACCSLIYRKVII